MGDEAEKNEADEKRRADAEIAEFAVNLLAEMTATRVTTLREWIEDPHHMTVAESVDEHGRPDFQWRFRDMRAEDPEYAGYLQWRRGTQHPNGKTAFRNGYQPLAFEKEMTRLGIPLDLRVVTRWT